MCHVLFCVAYGIVPERKKNYEVSDISLKTECTPVSAYDLWWSQEDLLHWLEERIYYIEV